jgi:hypothetical protein
VAAIIEKYTKVPAAVVKRAGAPHFDATGTIPVDNLQTLQSYFRERGVLEYDTDLDVTAIIDTTLVASVK